MKKLLWIGIPIILVVAIAAQLYLTGQKNSNIDNLNNAAPKPKPNWLVDGINDPVN